MILYVWGLGDAPFYSKGEPREATVVWEIYTSGEWILPLRNGHIIPSKPPLFHWLGALFSLAGGGISELTIRLPSALLATTGVLLTYAVGTALWGAEAGLVAGIILATSFEWARAAVSARVDMTLTVCMVAAFLLFFAVVSTLPGLSLASAIIVRFARIGHSCERTRRRASPCPYRWYFSYAPGGSRILAAISPRSRKFGFRADRRVLVWSGVVAGWI